MNPPALNSQLSTLNFLDRLMTVEQFAAWQQVPVATVRKRLASMPGVVRESRECVRIHPRTYLEGRLKQRR